MNQGIVKFFRDHAHELRDKTHHQTLLKAAQIYEDLADAIERDGITVSLKTANLRP